MKVGFIGLGIMGKPMSKNLLKAGHEVVCFDLNKPNVDEVAAAGAKGAASIADVAAACSFIITMLPNSPQVRQVALDAGGIADNAEPGTLLVDMSSIAPLAAREIHDALKAKNIRMLDAPVSGGEPKAIDGTLSVMVGGAQKDFDEAKLVLDAMAASVVRVGEIVLHQPVQALGRHAFRAGGAEGREQHPFGIEVFRQESHLRLPSPRPAAGRSASP